MWYAGAGPNDCGWARNLLALGHRRFRASDRLAEGLVVKQRAIQQGENFVREGYRLPEKPEQSQ